MSDEIEFPAIAQCRFGETGPIYDYIAPFPVAVGDRVKVESSRGGWIKARVAAIIPESDKAIMKVLEVIEPAEPKEETDGD